MSTQASSKTIGIVGGLGPWTGLDLHRRVLAATPAEEDQDHLSIVHLARPRAIGNRNAFLLGDSPVNPGEAIAAVVEDLLRCGAELIAIPCITAHAAPIIAPVEACLARHPSAARIDLRTLLEAELLAAHAQGARRCAVLCTVGSRQAQVFEDLARPTGLELAFPTAPIQARVQSLINAIKADGSPTWDEAGETRQAIVDDMREQGCDAVLLGCTELPLPHLPIEGAHVIDPNASLAAALYQAATPKPS